MACLPIDVLRLIVQALLGEERQDAYALLRPLSSFSLVCKLWHEAALTIPLRINVDYMQELPASAVRWLQKRAFVDLQVNPSMPINRLLTQPDFAARNRAVLTRLWGAAVAVTTPGRWPQFRHFPRLEVLELTCDHYAMPAFPAGLGGGVGGGPAAANSDPQRFESRMLAPLTALKHLSLQQFGSADLSRLPLSLETLTVGLYTALPLVLPEQLHLKELSLECSRLLVDWGKLCSQVEKVITIDAPTIDVLAAENGGDIFRQVAAGFMQGCVAEMEIVAQEVALVSLPPELQQPLFARRIPDSAYEPNTLEAVHTVTLAADFQTNHFRSFGCIYNPDDIQTDEELGLIDGVTVRLCRYLPDQPQVLGFCYGLSEEQMSYLLTEAKVGGLSLEAVEQADLEALLNAEEFQRRCGGSLEWMQGTDLYSSLQLAAFPELRRLECYVLHTPESLSAICQLPLGLTSLDLCGVCKEEGDVADRNNWPAFCPGRDPQHSHWDTNISLAHLEQLKELSLRYFREVRLEELMPASVEAVTLECLRPRQPWGRTLTPGWALTDVDLFEFSLPPLERGPDGEARTRSLTLQFHRNEDYPLRQAALRLSQFLRCATHLVVSVTADPPTDPAEGEEDADEEAAREQQRTCLVLVADGQDSLQDALDALTDSDLQSVDLEADEVLFTDANYESCTGSKRLQAFIQQHYSHAWLVWPHTAEDPDDPSAEAHQGGGFTMRRKQ